MKIAVASGKGGVGKTTVAAALAESLGPGTIFADCDVDAANGAIALGAEILGREPYFAGPGFRIDPAACSDCGLCARTCRFEAVRKDGETGKPRIVPELCERCGACYDVCPRGAVRAEEKQAGELFISKTRSGLTMVHAELVPGEDTSGKLVRRVRERAQALSAGNTVIVADCPPGIGCPVIASLTGADLILAVIEAGASGIRDAERLLELASSMKRSTVAVLNKTGLDTESDARARDLAARFGTPVAGEIPFDPGLRAAEERGRTWIDSGADAGPRVVSALKAVAEAVRAVERNKAEGKK